MLTLHKTLDFLAYWWHQAMSSRYELHLEREIKRLQAENSALWNTVWGTRGIPGHVTGPTSRAMAPTAASDLPLAVREGPAEPSPPERRGPVVVRSTTRAGRRTAEREGLEKHNAAVKGRIQELKDDLNEAITREKAAAQGDGYVVVDKTAPPVKVTEPADVVFLDEPPVQQEA